MGIVGFEILIVRASAGATLRKVFPCFIRRQELLPDTPALALFFGARFGFGYLSPVEFMKTSQNRKNYHKGA
jgi:hypothetical protein